MRRLIEKKGGLMLALRVMCLVLISVTWGCGGGDGGGVDGGGNGQDGPTSDFAGKIGQWTGDNGCMQGVLSIDAVGNGIDVTSGPPPGSMMEFAYTAMESEISFFGTANIDGANVTWACTLTCNGPTMMTLHCTRQDGMFTECTEIFTP